jgi:predicted dehydrogenase
MRFFQEHEYISLDFTRQDVLRVRVRPGSAAPNALLPEDTLPEINFEKLPTTPSEPLRTELLAFAESVRTRKRPAVDGEAGRRALELADRVMAGILEHARRVQVGAFSPQEVP